MRIDHVYATIKTILRTNMDVVVNHLFIDCNFWRQYFSKILCFLTLDRFAARDLYNSACASAVGASLSYQYLALIIPGI